MTHDLATNATRRPRAAKAGGWPIGLLLLLATPPLAIGAVRLGQQLGEVGTSGLLAHLPLILHVAGATIYALLGTFQFSLRLRQRWPAWHRLAGRVLVACGGLVALSALWLTLAYVSVDAAGLVLAGFRLVFGSAMLAALFLGLTAILRRDVPRHRAWMLRAYAIGLGAGTQMLVLMLAEIVAGAPAPMTRALLMGAAWAINLAVTEWRLRRPVQRRAATRPDSPSRRPAAAAPRG
jgi:hypothetical protein